MYFDSVNKCTSFSKGLLIPDQTRPVAFLDPRLDALLRRYFEHFKHLVTAGNVGGSQKTTVLDKIECGHLDALPPGDRPD